MTLQGTPAVITLSGISLLTTLPATFIVLLPIVTPGSADILAPIPTLSPTLIGNAISKPLALCSASIACPAVENTTLGAINTLSPKVTLAPSKIVQL